MLSLQRQITEKGRLCLDPFRLSDKTVLCMKTANNEGKGKRIVVFQKTTDSLSSKPDKVSNKFVTELQGKIPDTKLANQIPVMKTHLTGDPHKAKKRIPTIFKSRIGNLVRIMATVLTKMMVSFHENLMVLFAKFLGIPRGFVKFSPPQQSKYT